MVNNLRRTNKSPLVTVIVATFNMSATLSFTLRSIRAQTFRDFEVLVIGDACTDDSENVVKRIRDPRFRWLNLPRNTGGQWGPNNEGIRIARGRYVAYLGHDDLWFSWHLSYLVNTIENSGADLVYGLTALIGPQGLLGIAGPPGRGENPSKGWVPPSSWLHRRELTADIGPWRAHSELTIEADTDVLIRTFDAEKKMDFCKDLTVLKFPSPHWKSYARKEDLPQPRIYKRLVSNPHKLYTEILLEGSFLSSRMSLSYVPIRESLRNLATSIETRLFNYYGRDRWPLAPFLRRRFRSHRKKIQRLRGLRAHNS